MTLDSTPRAQGVAPARIGPIVLDPPVILAPMAGVTNAPFRRLCRRAGGALFVGEMITARALVEGHHKTMLLAGFHPDESPRSLQIYGVDDVYVGEAVKRLVDDGDVDHIDLNFGCPAPKVTRLGGGSALPVRRKILRAILEAAVREAGAIPVTAKFRIGTDDDHTTFLDTGRIAEESGCAAVALHARTAEQRYSGSARWAAIGELKQAVTSIPVFGNGDIWEAQDALDMMAATGCDGVVIGRGCLGRPWLFAELEAAFAGRPVGEAPRLEEVAAMMSEHLELLTEWTNPFQATKEFRKHTRWYLTGYPVGPDIRRRLALLTSAQELADILGTLDPQMEMLPAGRRIRRGHTNGPSPVALPDRWYDLADADDALDPAANALVSGG